MFRRSFLEKLSIYLLIISIATSSVQADPSPIFPATVDGIVRIAKGSGKILRGVSPFHFSGTDRHGKSKVLRFKTIPSYFRHFAVDTINGAGSVIAGGVEVGFLAPFEVVTHTVVGLMILGRYGNRYVYRPIKKAGWYARYNLFGIHIDNIYEGEVINNQSDIEKLAEQKLPKGIYSSKRRHILAKHRVEIPVETEELSNENLLKWTNEAKDRNAKRTAAISIIKEKKWPDAHNIHRTEIIKNYLESINRLETRYPLAVPNAELAFHQIYEMVETEDVSNRGAEAEAKRQAAIRYLDRVATQHHYDHLFLYTQAEFRSHQKDPMPSGLKNTEVLSLGWAAIHDRTVFHSDSEVSDRRWSLIETFALIQRLENLKKGKIHFDYKKEKDKPTCPVGTFTRILEHIDQIHPDVKINSVITNSDISSQIISIHNRIFFDLPINERVKIQTDFSGQGPHYLAYLNQLRDQVHRTAPLIQSEQIEELTNNAMMSTLLELD